MWRDGKETPVDIKLGEMPTNPQVASAGEEAQPNDNHADAVGLHLAPLSNDLRSELHVGHDIHGVVITRVDNGSVADNLGLTRGDIIESINQTLKGQLDPERHGGRTCNGVAIRVLQRILALTAVIWHNDKIGAPIKRSLIAYDH